MDSRVALVAMDDNRFALVAAKAGSPALALNAIVALLVVAAFAAFAAFARSRRPARDAIPANPVAGREPLPRRRTLSPAASPSPRRRPRAPS